ncbi:Potassium voltage-gated channel subfamily C member 2 [Fasciola gigantica]|uniref:Potassium voltage-gated channel subfamily C member 2 n=1 Tax=Fasciola gigantica TaxID=46835 RepID=A0A504Z3U5_FASGI|nr:Potassium voltage-gated channel subfamily C member 2 [Fasciola gigantica]
MVGPAQSTGKPADIICLCIGGRLFVTRRATLFRLPDSRLYLIATQGSSCETTTESYCATPFYDSAYLKPPASSPYPQNPGAGPNSLMRLHSNHSTENTTVGGATILPGNVATMLAGNMNLKSASSLCRNRGSIVPGQIPQPQLTPTQTDLNSSLNFSLPGTPSFGAQYPFNPALIQPPPPVVYFYDRDPEIFRFVLDYYRTGELHLPSSICGPFVRKELIFWGIDEALIGPCCMPAYMRYDEEKRTKNTLFRDCFEDIDSMQNLVKFSRGWKKWRYQMWLFMDHPSSSLPAKWHGAGEFDIYYGLAAKHTHNGLRLIQDDDEMSHMITICYDSLWTPNPKVIKDCSTEPTRGLVILDNALNCLFTTEFMLKVLLAPDKPKFLSSIVSILDIVILSSYWVYITVFYYYYYYPKTWIANDEELHGQLSGNLWLMNILSMTQSMRILRIFKISKISRGLRVLILTVKKSIPELVLLGFLLMNGMFMFSCLIYIAEYRVSDTFPDIPQSFWWSIITLTAVGYGDMYPKGGIGYFIGSVTAISGCVVTGLAIPIIGNNFNTYYKYMKNQLMEDKYLKNLRKDMESTGATGSKSGIGAAAEKSGLPLPGRKSRPMNRRGVRGKVRHNGLRQKLHHFIHMTSDPLRRIFDRSATNNGRGGKLGLSKNVDGGSTQALTESQHLTCNNIGRKSVVDPRNLLDSGQVSSRSNSMATGNNVVSRQSLCRTTILEASEVEKRLSIIHPLATDHLLSSLPPSRLSLVNTPQIWVDGEEMEDEISNFGRRFGSNEFTPVDQSSLGPDIHCTGQSHVPPECGRLFSPRHSILSSHLNAVPSYTELDVLGPSTDDMILQSEADFPEQLNEPAMVAKRYSMLLANSQRNTTASTSSAVGSIAFKDQLVETSKKVETYLTNHQPVVEKRMNYV